MCLGIQFTLRNRLVQFSLRKVCIPGDVPSVSKEIVREKQTLNL